jgi:hypothetical protein
VTRRHFFLLLAVVPFSSSPLPADGVPDSLLIRICGLTFEPWPALERLLDRQIVELGPYPTQTGLQASSTTKQILQEAFQISHGQAWKAVEWANPPGRLARATRVGLNSWGGPP